LGGIIVRNKEEKKMNKDRFLISNLTEEQIDIIFEILDHFNGDKNANKLARKCLSNIIKYDHTDYNKLAKDVKGVRR
jgi:hypothetical protein